MACETAVVASAVGGIKEVVVHGETGYLVPLEQMTESPFNPINPDQFSRDLAARINELMGNPELRKQMGQAGRRRAEATFSWKAIAEQTLGLYRELTGKR
jgi:glycosyltransferase involved in cell wall biosynthesis